MKKIKKTLPDEKSSKEKESTELFSTSSKKDSLIQKEKSEKSFSKGNKKKSPVKKKNLTGAMTAATQTEPKLKEKKSPKPFHVVGIGGSAGGLEAFTKLLDNLSPSLGMVYIFIPHLSPDFKSMLPEILERKTSMKVHKAKNKMKIMPNNIYVIPQGNYLELVDGILELTPRIKRAGVYYPIDHFFSSLANAYQNNAIGIILSGTGNDGILGLKAIKAQGGITFAQDNTAKYEGMPKSAREAGCVDFVLSPQKIAGELENITKHPFSVIQTPDELFEENKAEFKDIKNLFFHKKRIDFSCYKQTTINRRIMRRMLLNRLENLKDYTRLLKENQNEFELLYQDLLIHVTSFFREPEMYKTLANNIFPAIIKNKKPNDIIRFWIPGCATGEETYTIAMCLIECLDNNPIRNLSIQIFSTDINEASIEKARSGSFSKNALSSISPARLKRFFVKLNGGYQVIKPLRDICIFAPHNLLKSPPFSRLDFISCQNVLIYLEVNAQKKILQSFHYGLDLKGLLLLGKSETIGNSTELFSLYDKEHRIYTKNILSQRPVLDYTPDSYQFENHSRESSAKSAMNNNIALDIDKEINKLLLSRFVPPSVVVNKDLEIIQFRGSTSKFINPTEGKASFHLLKMVREELAFDLRNLIYKAIKERKTQSKNSLQINENGKFQQVSLEVVPLDLSSKHQHALVIFHETSEDKDIKISSRKSKITQSAKSKDKKILILEQRIIELREQIKSMMEEFESTREELQSSNEEILSSNEELQSINEELETSKEEMQSGNEELTTTNEELQNRNIELKEANDFSQAMVETIHESLIVLNLDFRVVKANKTFYKTFHLTPEETSGNIFFEIADNVWNIPSLKKQLKKLLPKNLHYLSFEMSHTFPDTGHKILIWNIYQLNLKDSNKSLILIAIQDVTENKLLEKQLKEIEEFREIAQNAFDIISILSGDGTIRYQSPSLETILGYKPEERTGKNIIKESLSHPLDRHMSENFINEILTKRNEVVKAEYRMLHKNGSYKIIEARGINLLAHPKVRGLIVTYRDITKEKTLEKQKDEFIGIASHELKTPVATIKAYSEILMNYLQKNPDTKAESYLKKLEIQIEKITSLINELLDVSRIKEGRMEFKKEYFKVNELIKESCEEMQSSSKGHNFILKLGKETEICGDRDRTGQVLTNLLSNAVKYSPDEKKIVISSTVYKNEVKIGIIDSGIGVDKSMKEKIFEKFIRVTTSDYSTYPGIGLGLFIANEIVTRQGGQIWVEDNNKKGSRFYFTLPIK